MPVAILLALLNPADAQMTRAAAEDHLRAMNGPLPIPREIALWSMTAPDTELESSLGTPTTERALAAVLEIRRARARLMPRLAQSLGKANARVGVAMIHALARTGEAPFRREVEAAVAHPVKQVRRAAAIFSARWGHRESVLVLREAVRNGSLDAVESLALVGSSSDWPVLREFYDEVRKSPVAGFGVRADQRALFALAALKEPRACAALRREMDHPTDRFFRATCVVLIGRLKDDRDRGRLLRALKDPEMRVRFAAAEALALAGRKEDASALRAASRMPGPDAANSGNERKGRLYMAHVADCLSRGDRPATLARWGLPVLYKPLPF